MSFWFILLVFHIQTVFPVFNIALKLINCGCIRELTNFLFFFVFCLKRSVLTDSGGCGCHGSVVEMADSWVKVAHWLQTAFTILLYEGTHGWKVVVQRTSKIKIIAGLHFLDHIF